MSIYRSKPWHHLRVVELASMGKETRLTSGSSGRAAALAQISAAVLKEHGALHVLECWLDESGPEAASYHATEARLDSASYGGFAAAAGAREGETVVVSYGAVRGVKVLHCYPRNS